jgi:hypothetical protein
MSGTIENELIIVTCYSNVQLILKSPLIPLFQRGRTLFPLFGMNHTVHTFGKEGLGEIRMDASHSYVHMD